MCFFFNDTATTEIYTLSLHDALPIYSRRCAGWLLTTPGYSPGVRRCRQADRVAARPGLTSRASRPTRSRSSALRSEEHTSELQSRQYLVCRLLLEKKKSLIY